MRILSECRLCVASAGLTNDKFVEIGGKPIPKLLIRLFGYFVCILSTLPEFIDCINNYSNGVNAILGPLHLALACLSNSLIRVSLIFKSDAIIELFDFSANGHRCT